MASPVIFVKGIPPSSTSAPRGRVPSPKRATTANRQFSLAASQGFEPRQRSRMSSNVRAPFAAPACLRLCSPSSFRFAKDRKFHLDRRDAQRVRLACEFNNRHAQAMTKGSDGTWSITCRYRRAHFLFPIQKNPGVDSTPGKEMRTRTNLRWHPMFSFRNVIWLYKRRMRCKAPCLVRRNADWRRLELQQIKSTLW